MSRTVEIRNTPDQRVYVKRLDDETIELTIGLGEPFAMNSRSEVIRLTKNESDKLTKAVVE